MDRTHRHLRAVAAALVTLAVLAGCSSSGSASVDKSSSTAASTTTSTTPTLTPNAGRTWGVGRVDIVLVDHSRDAVDKDGTVHKGRTLKTVVLYPTSDKADKATADDHPVAAGHFPLVVFSHGITASGPEYVPVMRKLAAAGYVVALPTFPLTAGPKGWSNFKDVVNQPADVSFVISQLFERAKAPSDLLHGHLVPGSVAIAGHSLGAITSLQFTNSCCRDRRVEAIVAISGLLFPAKNPSDSFDDPPTDLPILLLHGEKDRTVPYDAGSRHVFETFTKVPRAFVSFPGAGHVDILGSPSLMPSIVAFLNLELRHDPTDWRALGREVAKNGDAKIEVGGGLAMPG